MVGPGSSTPATTETQKNPPGRSPTGSNGGWVLATHSFPAQTFGALAFAGRLLPDATQRGKRCFGLMAGPPWPLPARDDE